MINFCKHSATTLLYLNPNAMKIAIISSSTDSLSLFKFLSQKDHEYLIYLDTLHAPYGEKTFLKSMEAVTKGIIRAQEQGAKKLILPPLYELAFSEDKNYRNLILPLFSHYVLKNCFQYSLVGKIGIFGDAEELMISQQSFEKLAQSYTPHSAQITSKIFSYPFHFWQKETSIFKHLLQGLSRKSSLSNTVIKHHLRYFKDAHVDTVIPINYSSFYAEKTISKFFNFKKIRFHQLDRLEKCFDTFNLPTSKYQIAIHATDSTFALMHQKKLLWLLQRGKQQEIQRC